MTILKNTLDDSAPVREFQLTRTFKAKRERVFQAWVDPRQVAQWWGPEGFCSPRCEWETKPEGKIHVDMRGCDGNVYPMTGKFLEVEEPERIVFVAYPMNAAGEPIIQSTTTVIFKDLGEETEILLHAKVENITEEGEQALGGMSIGWGQSLDRFATYLAQSPGDTSDRELIVMRLFNASRERVFDAFSQVEHISNWWGPRGFSTTTDSMDFRVGGEWIYTMHGPDGTDYPNRVIYCEINPPELIAYDHDAGEGEPGPCFHTRFTFTEEGGKTRVVLRMVFPSAKERDAVAKFGAIQGGYDTLTRLGEQLGA